MARPLKPLIRGGGGFYPSNKWTPLVYNGGYTTMDGGEEPSDQLNTFTGKIVQFLASAVKPIVNLTASLSPIQDLHGYANPWPSGGGKNKYNKATDTTGYNINASGVIVESSNEDACYSDLIPVSQGPITWSGISNVQWMRRLHGYDANGDWVQELANVSTTADPYEINATVPSGVAYVRLSGRASDVNVQVELSASKTAYAPYSNLCPISGHTVVTVYDTGINVWDEEWENGTFNTTTGANIVNANQIRSKNYIPIKAEQSYYFKTPKGLWVLFFDKDKNPVNSGASSSFAKDGNSVQLGADASHAIFSPPAGAYFCRFYCQNVYGTTYNNDISINYPSTDHDYHAYTGATYPITWLGNNLINQDGTDTGNGYVHKAYIDYNGIVQSAQGDWDVLEYVPVEPSTTYTLSGTTAGAVNGYAQYSSDKTMVSYGIVNASPFTFTTGANTHFVRFNRQYSTDTQVMLNVGSSALPYEQYRMVYKGTLKRNEDGSGVLTATEKYKRYSGAASEEWKASSWSGTNTFVAYADVAIADAGTDSNTKPGSFIHYCNMLKRVTYEQLRTEDSPGITITGYNRTSIRVMRKDVTNVTTLMTYLANNPLDIVYELATPLVYNLTAEQMGAVITTLKGQNTIWVDDSDEISVTAYGTEIA